jgi:TetR/AcrR family transcriptional repressor of nem operon
MDLSRSSFYDSFGDKRTLFLKVLALYSARVIQRTAQTLSEDLSPTAALKKVFDDLAAGAESDTGTMGCFMVNSVAELVPYDADVAKLATAYNLEMTGLLSKVLARGVKDKTVTRKQTPQQLAMYLFNTMQGIRILIKAGATRAQVEEISILTLNALK